MAHFLTKRNQCRFFVVFLSLNDNDNETNDDAEDADYADEVDDEDDDDEAIAAQFPINHEQIKLYN